MREFNTYDVNQLSMWIYPAPFPSSHKKNKKGNKRGQRRKEKNKKIYICDKKRVRVTSCSFDVTLQAWGKIPVEIHTPVCRRHNWSLLSKCFIHLKVTWMCFYDSWVFPNATVMIIGCRDCRWNIPSEKEPMEYWWCQEGCSFDSKIGDKLSEKHIAEKVHQGTLNYHF